VKIDTIESRQNRKGSGDKLQAATEWLIVSFIGSHTPYVLFPLHSAKVLPEFYNASKRRGDGVRACSPCDSLVNREESDLYSVLMIGIGGFIGAVLRYFVGSYVQDWSKSIGFPYGTLAVNLVGCLLIGMLTQLDEITTALSAETRLFVLVGFLGAFTTFSTFGNDTLKLIQDDRMGSALFNVGFHVVFGLGAVWLGRLLGYVCWK